MGQALYRKYRPTSFADAVGQQHITQTLTQAIKSGKISHAYLFTGPRGTGKTSIARILAHEVNDLPYKDDSIHLDIIEIDAASNRRIDEIRELRDKVNITPTSAKYKVYIIDEVHMLTREAFNALLKTLEEPPAHCIFILATTEVHKLPETIISRTQRFSFSPVSTSIVSKHLDFIAKSEKIKITEQALMLLAKHGQGSFRDSISLLDQLSTTGDKITEELVRDTLGIPAESAISELIKYIYEGNSGGLLENLEELSIQGTNTAAVAKEIGAQLRAKIINGEHEPWITVLLRQLLEVSASAYPEETLEIALLEAASKNRAPGKPSNPTPRSNTGSGIKKPVETIKAASEEKIVESKTHQEAPKTKKKELRPAAVSTNFNMGQWPQIVEYAKKHAASLYTGLRLAKPAYANGVLTLYFQFPLHQKKLNQSHQKDIIGQIIEEVSGSKVAVECEVNKEIFQNIKKIELPPATIEEINEPSKVSAPLKSISNIFGNAEMLS